MGDYKKQHFVPQSYLKRFSKNQKQIQVYDKVLNRSFSNGIRDVAQESNFYTLADEVTSPTRVISEDDKLVVEKALQHYENKLNRLIKLMIELPLGVAIPQTVRENFSILIAIQLLRTSTYRRHLEEGIKGISEAVINYFTEANFGTEALRLAPRLEFKKGYVGFLQSQLMFDFDRLAKKARVLTNHIWVIGINNTNKPFYTSDNPVVMQTALKNKFGGIGINSRGIEIAYPLSSRHILILADRKFYNHLASSDGKASNSKVENVEYYNSLQVTQCERQIFCEDADFDLVEKMLMENPDLSTEKMTKMKVNTVRIMKES